MQMPVLLKRTRAFCCRAKSNRKTHLLTKGASNPCLPCGTFLGCSGATRQGLGSVRPHSTARRRLLILRFWAILRAEGSSGFLASYFNSICCLTPFKATFFICKISSCFMNSLLVFVNISSWSNILHHILKVCACLDFITSSPWHTHKHLTIPPPKNRKKIALQDLIASYPDGLLSPHRYDIV